MAESAVQEVLACNQRLLDSIATADWKTYEQLCDDSLTCFEPEAHGHLVEGLPFHKFYFDLGPPSSKRTTTMSSPHVRLIGADVALVCYVRLVQRLDTAGSPEVVTVEETRFWQRKQGQWKHIHFHRSMPG